MEAFNIEANIRKAKWLLCRFGNPVTCKTDFYLKILYRRLALFSSHYENFIIIWDFNMEANDSAISVFSDDYYLKSHIKERINLLILKLFWLINYKFPTLLRNQNRFACFEKMTVHLMKTFFEKLQPTVVKYGNYKL